MKKIAITQRLILNESYYELRETLDVNWGLLFEKLDFLPIVLPLKYNFEEYFNNIEIDGILLTGGNDLNSINQSKESYLRDDFEKKLIEYAIINGIPIFGVCRGMQIIAEYFGANFVKVDNQVGTRDTLNIDKNSQYYNILKKLKKVNSYHNYAIDNLSSDWLVSSQNNEGIIKSIEHKKYKIFGQMWHSERDQPFNENELSLMRFFFND